MPGLLADATVVITAGRGFGQYRTVVDNTADTLTIDEAWRVVPDATSQYVVGPMFVENVLYGNLNNTPGRTSLWLDCIANLVIKHRDSAAGGVDIWGHDASAVGRGNRVRGFHRVSPAWYNMYVGCWLDGSGARVVGSVGDGGVHRGPPVFANYFVGNAIRQAHQVKSTWPRPKAQGAIVIGPVGEADSAAPSRAAISHTVVSGNSIHFTNNGVVVSPHARKTCIEGNHFQSVDQPTIDWGMRTITRGNEVYSFGPQGPRTSALPDGTAQRDLAAARPRRLALGETRKPPPLFQAVDRLKAFVSGQSCLGAGHAFCVYEGVGDPDKQRRCAENLRKLYELIHRYQARHGRLPDAAMLPRRPFSDADSIAVILGSRARPYLLCPTCGSDFHRFGVNYLWNAKLSGKRLTDVAEPDKTWLMMDFVAAHEWLCIHGGAGHLGGVNVLYADGTVRCGWPFALPDDADAWRRDRAAMEQWLEWARQ
jgi:prepilin-type processing-associated H-X9-DG protein